MRISAISIIKAINIHQPWSIRLSLLTFTNHYRLVLETSCSLHWITANLPDWKCWMEGFWTDRRPARSRYLELARHGRLTLCICWPCVGSALDANFSWLQIGLLDRAILQPPTNTYSVNCTVFHQNWESLTSVCGAGLAQDLKIATPLLLVSKVHSAD